MSGKDLNIAFSPRQMRVRLTFRAALCKKYAKPPSVLFEKARSKLQEEKDEGNLEIFYVYEEQFTKLWLQVQNQLTKGVNPAREVVFDIGAGAPILKGVEISPSTDDKHVFELSVKAKSKDLARWNFDWFKINVAHHLRNLGIERRYNDAQLYSSWLQASRGDPIINQPISVAPVHEPNAKVKKPFSIVGNRGRCEIIVYVYDASVLADKSKRDLIVRQGSMACQKLTAIMGQKVEFLKENLIERLENAVNGQEFFGLNLPAIYLVGYPAFSMQSPTAASFAAKKARSKSTDSSDINDSEDATVSEDYPGKGLVKFVVSDNNMEVTIEDFDKALYDHPEVTLSTELIEKELQTNGFKLPLDDKLKAEIDQAINRSDDLSGKLVLVGKPPFSGDKPYLHASFRDAKHKDSETLDIREHQQRSIVQKGDLVAEIKYEKAPHDGIDVYGNKVPPSSDDSFTVTLGEGIELKGDGKYYATFDGLPSIEDNAVSLSKILVHEGDVNLRSGNIHFTGPAEIKGAIDSGAVVEVTGDLIVHGTIRDAQVVCGGTLDAKEGIVTGQHGRVRARNDILADFIENSNIISGGNIYVKKAILNSRVFCGGGVETNTNDGVVAGGRISSRKYIKTGNLGFPKGAQSKISVGVDWRVMFAIDVRSARFEKLQAYNQEQRNALRELTRKKVKTKKNEEQIVEIKNKVAKSRAVLDKLKLHLENAEANLSYDADARIYVYQTLYANCQIDVAGTKIPVTHEVAEVEVTPRRTKGSYIAPLSIDNEKNSKNKAS